MRKYKYGSSSLKQIDSVSPKLQAVCHRAIKIANSRRLYCPDFGISCGKRSKADQLIAFKAGRSNCDGVNKLSRHQYGFAIDFFGYVRGKTNYEEGNMALIATCFMEAAAEEGCEINWGGNFNSFSDSPHIELVSK